MRKHALIVGLVLGLAQVAFPAFAKGPTGLTVRQAKKEIASECRSYGGEFFAKHVELGYLTNKMNLKTALRKGPVSWDLRSGKNAEGYLGLRGILNLNGKSLVVTLDRGKSGRVIEDHYTNHH